MRYELHENVDKLLEVPVWEGRRGGEVTGDWGEALALTGDWEKPLYLKLVGGSPCTYRWLKMLRMTPKSICPIPRMTAIFIL